MDNTRNQEMIVHAQSEADRIQAGFSLDFSIASLQRVDELLGSIADCGNDLAAGAAYMFGCYVGEVLVRQAGAVWVVEHDMEEEFGSPLVLRAGPFTGSPFRRCRRRIRDEELSVESWGELVVDAASGRLQTLLEQMDLMGLMDDSSGDRNDSEREGA